MQTDFLLIILFVRRLQSSLSLSTFWLNDTLTTNWNWNFLWFILGFHFFTFPVNHKSVFLFKISGNFSHNFLKKQFKQKNEILSLYSCNSIDTETSVTFANFTWNFFPLLFQSLERYLEMKTDRHTTNFVDANRTFEPCKSKNNQRLEKTEKSPSSGLT